jgi:hypothetical protein
MEANVNHSIMFHGRFKALWVATAILFAVGTAHAADYYVNGATGNDANAGTSSTAAWKTIQKAANSMPAGNTCNVAPGTYTGRVTITRSGTATAPLVFKASGSGVIVNGFTVDGSSIVKYVVIDGFEVTLPRQSSLDGDVTGTGVALINTQYCEVRNCYIHHTLREGVMLYAEAADDSTNSSYNVVANNTIAYAGGYAGITVNGAYQRIENNDISHSIQNPLYPTMSKAGGSDADGIKFCGRDLTIRGNYIHDISPSETGNVDPHVDALQTFGPAYNILIEGNHINLPTNQGETQASMVEQIVQPVQDITIRENIVTAYRGFNIWGINADTNKVVPLYRVTIANNTFYGVKDYDFELHDCPSSVVKNNSISASGRYMWTNSSPTTGNNAVPGSLTLKSGDIRIADPMYVDPATRNFHLKSGSPLIDKGANLGYTADFDGTPIPQGSAPDIGAFEYKQTSGGTPDTTAPVITLLGSATVTVNAGSTYTDAGATASDNVDGDITSRIVKTGSVNTAKPGAYTLTYNVSDSAGNAATPKTRSVTVVDNTKPVITLVGSASVTVALGSTYTDAGATATDNVDGDITSRIVKTSNVNTQAAGTYTVTYNVSDAAGNAATPVTRTVTVSSSAPSGDTTRPVITLLGSATVNLSVGASYTDAGATATDNVDGDITSRIVRTGTVDTSKAGTYTLTYNVSDSAGNAATPVTRTVKVGSTTGTQYYVNTATGSNTNNGTSPTTPWKTIQKAANTMPAGSTCNVAPGNYAERVKITKSGTATSPITFKASGAGVYVKRGFEIKGSSTVKYVVIDGFEITVPRSASYDDWNIGSGVSLIETQYCQVVNCHIYSTLREGIMIFTAKGDASNNSSYNTVLNNRIEYAGQAGITLNGAYQTVDGNDISHTIQHPLYPTLSTAGGADADGIVFFGHDHVMRSNYIHDITSADTGNVDPHTDAFQTYGPAYNITVARNTVSLPLNGDDNQAAMVEQNVKPVKDLTFRYNVVTAYRGFNIWGINADTNKVVPLYRVTVTNNTFYGVKDYDVELHDCPSSVVKNNSISASGRYMWTNSSPTTGSNAVPGSLTLRSGDYRISDPMYVDPANRNFHLKTGSPLIDKGANLGYTMDYDGTPVPDGGAPDVGSYEYHP